MPQNAVRGCENRNRKLKQYGAELYISMVLDQITLIVVSDYKSISQHLSNDQRITENMKWNSHAITTLT